MLGVPTLFPLRLGTKSVLCSRLAQIAIRKYERLCTTAASSKKHFSFDNWLGITLLHLAESIRYPVCLETYVVVKGTWRFLGPKKFWQSVTYIFKLFPFWRYHIIGRGQTALLMNPRIMGACVLQTKLGGYGAIGMGDLVTSQPAWKAIKGLGDD